MGTIALSAEAGSQKMYNMKITHLYINMHPGSWKMIPWISSLKPTAAGTLYYIGGWQLEWLCFRIQRHQLKTL